MEQSWWVQPHLRNQNHILVTPTSYEEVLLLRETKNQVEMRIKEFIHKLAAMPQQHIVVVGHSHFFKRMLHMNRKLANCELTVMSLHDIAAGHGIELNNSTK